MFVEIENAIVTRLTEKFSGMTLPATPRVYTGADFSRIKDRSQGDASVIAMYNGLSGITPLAPNVPSVVTVSQDFIIWTQARSASRHDSQEGTREIADPIMMGILEALCGWRYAPGKHMLELAETPGPAYEDGFGYFPLMFRYKTQVRGNPN
jgi:hypothetical protein